MNQHDVFRPRQEPARSIYDAFQAEAALRPGRSVEEWCQAERLAVWRAARDYAQAHELTAPSLAQVERAEQYALGGVDYGLQWALQVSKAMKPIVAAQ